MSRKKDIYYNGLFSISGGKLFALQYTLEKMERATRLR
jgi:hypothetical protein